MVKALVDKPPTAGMLWRLAPGGYLVNKASGLLLEPEGYGVARKTPVDLGEPAVVRIHGPDSATAQRWRLTKPGRELECELSGKVLTVAGGSPNVGARTWVNDRNGSKAQRWTFSQKFKK
jgi:hypothetical protein